MPIEPFLGRQSAPGEPAGDEIRSVVSHNAEKFVIGLKDPAFEISDQDADDVGFDQAPDLCFPLLQIAVQTGVFQRDRGLRGKQLQHRNPSRRETRGARLFSR